MNHFKTLIALCSALFLLPVANAQSSSAIAYAVDVVDHYNTNLKGFVNEGEVEYLENIDEILRGGDIKCVINNRLAKSFAEEKKWGSLTMHSDTYHNELSNHHDNGSIASVELSDYQVLIDWVEPRIKMSDFELPTMFISAKMKVNGPKSYDTNDLFFVQGNHIVMIDDFDAQESLSKALEYYKDNNHKEAFRIFQKLAYTSRNARKAQYYYVVMLIKGQGCDHISKKVRDIEAAWFSLGGYKANDKDLSDLATKFSMSIQGSTFDSIWLYRPSYDGRRTICKKGKYGIMDNNGRMVFDFHKGYCSPISPDGYATVSADGKTWGLMDSYGNQILPYDYYNIVPYLVADKFMAVKDNSLYILSKTGVPLRIIEGAFQEVRFVTEENLAVVINGNKAQLYDFEGNLLDEGLGSVTHGYMSGEIRFCHPDETTPYRTLHIKW